jgi:hypothetical protein
MQQTDIIAAVTFLHELLPKSHAAPQLIAADSRP